MPKRLNPNLVRIHRSYTVEEVADLFAIHKNTVRNWVKQGLTTCENKKPVLILGSILKEYLKEKRNSKKHKCLPIEIYCLRCRHPQIPAEKMVDFEIINQETGRLIGLCPCCNSIINKYVKTSMLEEIQDKLDITQPKAPKHIIREPSPPPKQ